MKEGFYLARGTACAIQLGHRISVALDFVQEAQFQADQLAQQLALEGTPLAAEEVSPGSVKGQLAGIAVSFFHYPYPLLNNHALLRSGGCSPSAHDTAS